MAVLIKTGLDTAGANADLSKLQSGLKDDLGDALKRVEAQAAEAQKSLADMLKIDKAEFFVSKFGDVKDILEKAGVAAFGLSEQTVKAGSSALDLAQKFASVGSVLGPLGTVGGAAIGAVTGYLVEANKAAAEAEAALRDVHQAISEATVQFDRLAATDLSGVIDQIVELQKQLDTTGAFNAAEQARIDALAKQSVGELAKEYLKLADAAAGVAPTFEDLLTLQELEKQKLASLSDTARAASTVLQSYANAEGLTAESAQKQARELVDLQTQIDASKGKIDSYQKAINAYAVSTSTATTAVKAHTKAIKDNGDAVAEAARVAEEASRARVASINEETRAFLERAAINEERRQEDGSLFDVEGFREMRGEASALTDETLRLFEAFQLLPDIELPTAELDAMTVALDQVGEAVGRLKEQLQEALVNVGVGAAQALFDNIEAGKRPFEDFGNTVAKVFAEQLKGIGTLLIGEGLSDEFKAASLAIRSFGLDPRAPALAGVGLSEIGLGLLMGGSGALLGRRANRGEATSPSTATSESLGAREAEASGPRELAPVKIFLGPESGVAVFADDARGVANYGRFTEQAQANARKAPR